MFFFYSIFLENVAEVPIAFQRISTSTAIPTRHLTARSNLQQSCPPTASWSVHSFLFVYVTCGLFRRDTMKVAKSFLGPEMPLSTFWQMLNFGETLSEEAEKVLGYQVAKHFLCFLWKCLAIISPCQNAESGISGPRKRLATFTLSRQNKLLVQGAKISVFKLDTTEINERTLILPICGFHTLTVYGLLLTPKKIVSCANARSSASWNLRQSSKKMVCLQCLHPVFDRRIKRRVTSDCQ